MCRSESDEDGHTWDGHASGGRLRLQLLILVAEDRKAEALALAVIPARDVYALWGGRAVLREELRELLVLRVEAQVAYEERHGAGLRVAGVGGDLPSAASPAPASTAAS